jgi:hypothetical protein
MDVDLIIIKYKAMKYLMKVRIPNETGTKNVADPQFGMKMQEIFKEVKAETVYFTTISGCRGCYVVVNITDASQIPGIAEPFFMWLKAEIDFLPVMTLEDLGKAGPSIESAYKKWGK